MFQDKKLRLLNGEIQLYGENKVDVQNKICIPRAKRAMWVKKQFFELIISSPPPRFGPFRALIYKKKCLGAKLVLTNPSGLI